MRINIITLFGGNNYGKILQAFALRHFVSNNSKVYFSYYIKQCFWETVPLIRQFLGFRRFHIVQKNVFVDNLLPNNSYRFGSRNNISKEILIVGSDQIWNPHFVNGEWCDVFFLNTNKNPKTKRIAYAASLGMQQWPKDYEIKVLPMLKQFNSISVREESSVPYLTSLELKNVACVCDPTILHKGNFYRMLFKAIETSPKYALIYKIRQLIPENVSSILPQNVITVDLQKKETMVSVRQWLAYVDHAEFVVTDSFHCVVFCLLFHKSFIVLPNHSSGVGMNERFLTLLGKTNLNYRIISSKESIEQIISILNHTIDWSFVDTVLDEWRTFSGDWLKNALEIK